MGLFVLVSCHLSCSGVDANSGVYFCLCIDVLATRARCRYTIGYLKARFDIVICYFSGISLLCLLPPIFVDMSMIYIFHPVSRRFSFHMLMRCKDMGI